MGRIVTLNKKRLTKKEVKELTILPSSIFKKKVTELYRKNNLEIDVYQLEDQNYLLIFREDNGINGKGDIWPKDYIEREIQGLKNNLIKPQNTLSNFEHWHFYSSTKEEFKYRIKDLISNLEKQLSLKNGELDNSYNSLDKLSNRLNSIDHEDVEKNYYDQIVAYLGETLIANTDGQWNFFNDAKIGLIPQVQSKDEIKRYCPITPIWVDLISHQKFNLRERLIDEIRSQSFK